MIGVINYGAGNLFSLQCALDRIGAVYEMIQSPDNFDQYEKYIIPGVGHAGAAMKKLEQTQLVPLIRQTKKPVLGICVGQQLLTRNSEEGNSDLLGVLPLETKKFISNTLKIPQMGWNNVFPKPDSILFHNIKAGDYFYFVHSYYVEEHPEFTAGTAEYTVPFSAAVHKNNFYGVQFHPEKSGKAGEQLLRNFVSVID